MSFDVFNMLKREPKDEKNSSQLHKSACHTSMPQTRSAAETRKTLRAQCHGEGNVLQESEPRNTLEAEITDTTTTPRWPVHGRSRRHGVVWWGPPRGRRPVLLVTSSCHFRGGGPAMGGARWRAPFPKKNIVMCRLRSGRGWARRHRTAGILPFAFGPHTGVAPGCHHRNSGLLVSERGKLYRGLYRSIMESGCFPGVKTNNDD